MSYITREISIYSVYTLIPIYSILLINLTFVLFLKKHKTVSKYKWITLFSGLISIVAVVSQIFYQGVLKDNLVEVKALSLQTNIALFLLLLLLIATLVSIIKGKK